MNEGLIDRIRIEAKEIFKSSYEAVDPYEAVRRFVSRNGDSLRVETDTGSAKTFDLGDFERIFLVGGGKASAPMAKALEEMLGDRISEGVVNVKYGFTEDLSFTELVEANHPVPDEKGVGGARRIVELLKKAGEKDLIFSLISGGGSALLPLPAGEISLSEKQKLTQSLLECGATIDEINAVRKHISLSKGGQMARFAYPATTVNLMLSDVVGDKVDVIASGPFTPDGSSFEDVRKIFDHYGLSDIPQNIGRHVDEGFKGKIPETPKEGESVFEKVTNVVVGSNILALLAAEEKARELGYNTLILSSMVEGETKELAHMHSAIAKEILSSGRPLKTPACIISGGETTVTIHGDGLGGRNQEFCLAAAMDIEGMSQRIVILSGGTDGNDGPTDAAGALVDSLTVKRGAESGLSAYDFLRNNDSYNFFKETSDLLITGPTRTNVMDVRLVLVR